MKPGLIFLTVVGLLAQSQSPARGFILGRVVDATTNKPIAGATVALIGPPAAGSGDALPVDPAGSSAPRVLTGDDGQFLFRNLSAGNYSFTATAVAYLDGAYGQTRPDGPGRPFALGDGERAGPIAIRLWREAGIGGRVTDDTGEPLVNANVSLVRRSGISSARATNQAVTGATTDDRGAYRFTGLPPGEYLVAVASRMTQVSPSAGPPTSVMRLGDFSIDVSSHGAAGWSNVLSTRLPTTIAKTGRVTGYVTTFAPSAPSVTAATVITLKAGDTRTGVDVMLKATSMVSVKGHVNGPSGTEANLLVHLMPAFAAGDPLARTFDAAIASTDGAGAFVFAAVPAGSFVLEAWRSPQILVIGRDPMPADTSAWGRTSVTVADAPVDGVALTLEHGRTISGQVKFEGAAAAPNPVSLQTMLSVAFEPAWTLAFGSRMATRVSATGEFSTQGLPPGEYFANMPNNFSPRGWYLDSVTRDGHDLTVEPLTLGAQDVAGVVMTFTDRPAQLNGKVNDSSGKPDSSATVLVIPGDYHAWIDHGLSRLSMRVIAVSQTANYAVNLRPGEYLVAAVSDDVVAGPLSAAAVQAIAATATRVTIARGEAKTQNLTRGRQ